jgi:hypothetical protein
MSQPSLHNGPCAGLIRVSTLLQKAVGCGSTSAKSLIDGERVFCHTVAQVVERKRKAASGRGLQRRRDLQNMKAVRSTRNENAFEMRRQRVVWT